MLKKRRAMITPVVCSAVLVFIVLIPVLPSAYFTLCHGSDCVGVIQYDSISYDYGGWGAVGNTDGYYSVDSWMCSVPAVVPGQPSVQYCVTPYGDIIWPAVALLLAADVASMLVVMGWVPNWKRWWQAPMRGFLRNRVIGSGVALLILGTFVAVLGLGAYINYLGQTCFVHPGLGACYDTYQVALLAPLYPLSGEVLMTGLLIVVLGFAFTALGLRQPGQSPDISAGKPTN